MVVDSLLVFLLSPSLPVVPMTGQRNVPSFFCLLASISLRIPWAARLPTGPALLAQRTGAALVGGFGWYRADTHIEAQFVPLSLELPEEQRRDFALLMDRIVEKMEHFIRAHPEQWVVFSPIWTAPATTVSVEA